MKTSILLLFALGSAFAETKATQEEILLRKAALVAKKVHVKNLNLIGIDPKSCRPIEDSKVFLSQMSQIKKGSLTHCPDYAQEKLKSLDEEIKQVEAGVLIYPKKDAAPQLPVFNMPTNDAPKDYQDDNFLDEEAVSPEIPLPPKSAFADHTGLTSEQKLLIFENYDKNKESYESDDYDNLFQIVSKAYVRNLRKIIPEN